MASSGRGPRRRPLGLRRNDGRRKRRRSNAPAQERAEMDAPAASEGACDLLHSKKGHNEVSYNWGGNPPSLPSSKLGNRKAGELDFPSKNAIPGTSSTHSCPRTWGSLGCAILRALRAPDSRSPGALASDLSAKPPAVGKTAFPLAARPRIRRSTIADVAFRFASCAVASYLFSRWTVTRA
jgi:hypothetical protein